MLESRSTYLAVILASLCSVAPSFAQDETGIDQLVDVVRVGRELYAIRAEGNTSTTRLRSDESVLWSGSYGQLGAAVTDQRLLVVGGSGSGWRDQDLRLAEPESPTVKVSSNLVLLDTGLRVLGFDAVARSFIEWKYPLGERVSQISANREVAAFVLDHSVVGYAVGGSFGKLGLQLNETVSSLSTKSKTATVVTSRRILSFRSGTGRWSVTKIPLNP